MDEFLVVYEVFIFSCKVIFNPYPRISLTLEELEGSKVRETEKAHGKTGGTSHPAALSRPISGYAKALELRDCRSLSSSNLSQSKTK